MTHNARALTINLPSICQCSCKGEAMIFTEAKHEARHQRQTTKSDHVVVKNKSQKYTGYVVKTEQEAVNHRMTIHYNTRR